MRRASRPDAADPSNPWIPGAYSDDVLRAAVLSGRIAGEITSHDRNNVLWKIKRLVDGDPTSSFGLSGLGGVTREEVLAMVAEEAGFDPDPMLRDEPVPIDPDMVLASCRAAGVRLADAARRGERVALATGHPAGLSVLYMSLAELLEEHGAKLLRPLQGDAWRKDGRRQEVRYLRGVGVLTDRGSALHTHSPEPMERMLEEVTPDLVLADHGFAGAAIEAGITTLSIADVNDPALPLAQARGRTAGVLLIDDGLDPSLFVPVTEVIRP